jgi:hypothetical protein
MSERSLVDSLSDYERKVWNDHHSAVPLRPRGGDDLPSHHKREYEKLKEVWNWGVGLHNQGGAIRLEEEVQGLERELENFRVDAPGEKDRVYLGVLREDLRRWQRLRKDATERVEEGGGDEAVGPREEDRYDHILADTTYGELQKTANLAVRGRKEALDKGRRRRDKVQLKLQVCRDLIRRARSLDAIKRLGDESSPRDGSDEEVEERAEETTIEESGEEPPITGYRGPEYAVEAVKILRSTPITTFSDLESEMEEPTVGGESKVDTVKRNIGYEDLPKEEKEFPRFREMLTKKVDQIPEEE